jgi:hypothetical protein
MFLFDQEMAFTKRWVTKKNNRDVYLSFFERKYKKKGNMFEKNKQMQIRV